MNFEDPYFIENNSVAELDKLIEVYTEYSFKEPELLILDEIPKGATGKQQRIGLAQNLGLA